MKDPKAMVFAACAIPALISGAAFPGSLAEAGAAPKPMKSILPETLSAVGHPRARPVPARMPAAGALLRLQPAHRFASATRIVLSRREVRAERGRVRHLAGQRR